MSVLTPEEKQNRRRLYELKRSRKTLYRKARQDTARLSRTLRQCAAVEEIIASIERAKGENDVSRKH